MEMSFKNIEIRSLDFCNYGLDVNANPRDFDLSAERLVCTQSERSKGHNWQLTSHSLTPHIVQNII